MDAVTDRPTTALDFSEALEDFERSRRQHPTLLSEHRFRIAGQEVHLRVVGAKLAEEVAAPFAHLAVQSEIHSEAPPSVLHIDAWHGAECGVSPGFVHPASSLGPYGTVTASPDGSIVAEHRPHSGAWLDRKARRIVAWVSDRESMHLDERARPFHRLLAVAMGDRDVQFAHAGLVATDGKGALFVGKGGSGKSTSSLTCLIEGMDYLGDDFVGISSREAGHHLGHSLYASAVVGLGHTARYPALAAAARPGYHPHETKSLVDLSKLRGGRLISQVQIRAVVLPRVTDAERTSFRPAAPRDGLIALAPSSLMLVPGSHSKTLERLAALTSEVPCFWLDLGRDLGQTEPRLRELLATVRMGS